MMRPKPWEKEKWTVSVALAALIIFLFPGEGFTQNSMVAGTASNPPDQIDKSSAEPVEWVKNVTRKYSPDSWASITEYENVPAQQEGQRAGGWIITLKKSMDTFHYLDGEGSRTNLLGKMALNIRAVTLAMQRHHLFQHTREKNLMMDWEKAEVFLNMPCPRPLYISFPLKSLFPCNKIAEEIPADRRTALFETYIKDSAITQRFGVVGLLEEYHAHYLGSKFYYDMLEAYKIAEDSDAGGFLAWVRHSQSTMSAFYELDFFIREYLLYMKKHHPDNYEKLKAHRPFMESYAIIRISYEKLVDRYLTLIHKEIQRLNASGKVQAGLANNILWVRAEKSNNSSATELFAEKEKIKDLIESDRFLAIQKDFPKTP